MIIMVTKEKLFNVKQLAIKGMQESYRAIIQNTFTIILETVWDIENFRNTYQSI